MIVVIMGVSGSGKSSVGRGVAAAMDWSFIEGDDLHPTANRKKMTAGQPLTDNDRWPWLDALAAEAARIEKQGSTPVVACSALRRAYRDRLRQAGEDVRFVHLAGSRATIAERMTARTDHFMPPGLLDSQLATLEAPENDEAGMHVISIEAPVDAIVQQVIDTFKCR